MHTCSVSSPQPSFLLSQCIHMPAFALKNNRSPWTAVLPPSFLWQSWWLTVRLTIPFSHHLLAVNQACHPGAIDRAVSLCEMCLSKPLYTVVDRVTFFLFVLPVSFPVIPISNMRWSTTSNLFCKLIWKVAWYSVWLFISYIFQDIVFFATSFISMPCHLKFQMERLNHFVYYVVKIDWNYWIRFIWMTLFIAVWKMQEP